MLQVGIRPCSLVDRGIAGNMPRNVGVWVMPGFLLDFFFSSNVGRRGILFPLYNQNSLQLLQHSNINSGSKLEEKQKIFQVSVLNIHYRSTFFSALKEPFQLLSVLQLLSNTNINKPGCECLLDHLFSEVNSNEVFSAISYLLLSSLTCQIPHLLFRNSVLQST